MGAQPPSDSGHFAPEPCEEVVKIINFFFQAFSKLSLSVSPERPNFRGFGRHSSPIFRGGLGGKEVGFGRTVLYERRPFPESGSERASTASTGALETQLARRHVRKPQPSPALSTTPLLGMCAARHAWCRKTYTERESPGRRGRLSHTRHAAPHQSQQRT